MNPKKKGNSIVCCSAYSSHFIYLTMPYIINNIPISIAIMLSVNNAIVSIIITVFAMNNTFNNCCQHGMF